MLLRQNKRWVPLALGWGCVLVGGFLAGGGTLAALTDRIGQAEATMYEAGSLGFLVENENIRFTDATGTLDIPIDRLAPGDRGVETFDLRNDKELDLKYDVTGGVANGPIPITGVDPLQDLRVSFQYSSDDGANWISVVPGDTNLFLPAGGVHKYRVSYEVPLSADNRYQNASGTLQLLFLAEQLLLSADCFLPPFSNRNFTLHQGSTVPIKFHLGEREVQPGDEVQLVISGPGADGEAVRYTYTMADGSLRKNGNHYQVSFSTRNYEVVTGGVYKATVYVDGTAVCEKEFAVERPGSRSNAPKKKK